MDKSINAQAAHACVSSSTVAAAPAARTCPKSFCTSWTWQCGLTAPPTARGETGDKPTVMIYLQGHIAAIEINIHSVGWEVGRATT